MVGWYLVRKRLFRGTWLTNVSCLLNTLGSVALYFDNVYPAPDGPREPSSVHRAIARAVDQQYRDPIYISANARLDWSTFTFRRCSKTSVFRKRADDKRFHHRDSYLNDFYLRLLDFEEGDELLQVARCSMLSMFTYPLRLRRRRKHVARRELPVTMQGPQ